MLNKFEEGLKEFWDMPVAKEDIDEMEENVCEEIYAKTFQRATNRSYIVPIPWENDFRKLGNSFDFALKCYLSHERRLNRDSKHKNLSDDFMKEYIHCKHMSLVPNNDRNIKDGSVYYIPYHSVLKKDAVTTKLRNVFNASAKTSNGVSLNAIIHPGPKLQNKIFDIVTRIRQYKFMYSSDITKMYRQILLMPEDRNKLRILFRENSTFAGIQSQHGNIWSRLCSMASDKNSASSCH